ncbi:hypothetical protein [Rhizobium sp. BK176]|uniref:hypothetical protein n=1 Tax=Rhizobium sp. BK176 TaxID=2587071 RepID=UPI002168FD3A|nr:hypothetical protein [Rhizobium sp. BK176]MCS4089451.1 hypothetical protein [Rhizobium sp. BK176]
MRIEAKLPFLTRGQPQRCSAVRDIYVSMPTVFDVPEVSASETNIVFETDQQCTAETVRRKRVFRMREYDGTLYRKIASLPVLDHLVEAFGNKDAARLPDPGCLISMALQEVDGNPLASALRRQHEWQLDKRANGNSNVVMAWPQGDGPEGRERVRGGTDFPKIAPTTEHLNREMCEISQRMIEAKMSKLLVIDDGLWMASRPPSWRVSVDREGGKWDRVDVRLDLAVAIEGFDPMLARRHFPLGRLEEAKAYAALCAKTNADERNITYTRRNYIVDYAAERSELLDFDADAEELARIGYAMAMECVRFGHRAQKKMEELGDLRNALDAAFALTMQTNYVLGEMGDIGPYVEDLCAIWKKCSRPISYCVSGTSGSRFGNLLLRRAKVLAENAPITFGLGFGGGHAPERMKR